MCEASKFGIRAALSQSQKVTNKMNLISACSRFFLSADFQLFNLMRQCTAILYKFTESDVLILGLKHPTVLFTGHKPLIYPFTQKANPNHRVYYFQLNLIQEIFVTDDGKKIMNNEIITLSHLCIIKHKPQKSHAPWINGLVEGMNCSLQKYPHLIVNGKDTNYTKLSADVRLLPLPYNSQITTALVLSPFEMFLTEKPIEPKMLTSNSSKIARSHCQPTKNAT